MLSINDFSLNFLTLAPIVVQSSTSHKLESSRNEVIRIKGKQTDRFEAPLAERVGFEPQIFEIYKTK